MLAVLDQTVAKSPEGLRVAGDDGGSGVAALLEKFVTDYDGTVVVELESSCSLAYTVKKESPLLTRLFAVLDNIFCLFEGEFENVGLLKQQYGLNKTANEVVIVIEAYRTLRDRGAYPADQVVRDFHGKFAFVLYDNTNKSTFIAADPDGGIPFFWGCDPEGHLILSDNVDFLRLGCGKSFAPFPKGCFFSTKGGLQSYEHPLNELKPVPRVDSKGEVLGVTYKVDAQTKKGSSMPRVGSAADWSSQY
ncbi:stem-specific protein TSJT1-like [Dioscorea cayenensis subsp. rotundata]|uniref:Stem-specific protein TSJT1-like n=1 Tax=Dioscorea cayennensis subsp. rotundata TaxID=55577 RepID=A0AB40AGT4_DIOCR|nr:stem-specific protein TSJT1-like [Dioscorea cayenensis subsp. rotundata]